MIRKILIFLSFILFSCNQNYNQSISLYGDDFNYDSIQSISSLINNANKFLDKQIITEGNIVDVCPMKGCWIEIKDSDFGMLKILELDTLLTPGRRNGVYSMLEKIKEYANSYV